VSAQIATNKGLVERLLEESSKGASSLAKIASNAKVSTKFIFLVRDPKKWKKEIDIALGRITYKGEKRRNGRRLAGLAGSATRLAVHLGINPESAVQELGMNPLDTEVEDSIRKAAIGAQRIQLVDDSTLARIKGRAALEKGHGGVVDVAILNWRPFYDSATFDLCFAKQYMEMLLGALDPSWTIKCKTEDSIRGALDGLLADPPKYDVVFGLYALPFRRSLGLEFVPVPGLRVPLGLLSKTSDELRWKNIITLHNDADVIPVVLDEEAGYHLIRGALRYSNPMVIKQHVPRKIAIELVQKIEEAGKRGKKAVFVADCFTCGDVNQAIQEWRSDAQLIPNEIALANLPELTVEIRRGSDQMGAPSYPAALGIRANAKFFNYLLIDSTREDLFYNAAPRTAELYLDLLLNPVSKDLVVTKEAFSWLGEEALNQFAIAYCHSYNIKKHDHPSIANENKPATQLYTAMQNIVKPQKRGKRPYEART
jgi:hypothetical protein